MALLVVLSPGYCFTLRTRQSAPPTDSVKIGRVTTSGNGCLRSDVPFNITNPDQNVVFQHLTEFHGSLGPSIVVAERTKNCAFHIGVTYPRGWQFTFQQSSYGGYARLDKGVGVHFNAQYYLSSAPSNSVSHYKCVLQLLRLSRSGFQVLEPNGVRSVHNKSRYGWRQLSCWYRIRGRSVFDKLAGYMVPMHGQGYRTLQQSAIR